MTTNMQTFHARLHPHLHQALIVEAKRSGRSANNQLNRIMQAWFDHNVATRQR